MIIALGSARASKIMSVRSACRRIAAVESQWARVELIARPVDTTIPSMPLTDTHLMRGARERAEGVRQLLLHEGQRADFYIGLEGGFHSTVFEGERHTFLRGWAYATDGHHGYFGTAPSVTVPPEVAARVERSGRELSDVIDEITGEFDVRSRQGAWGVLSRGLLTRAMSFETSLVAALAPFYNPRAFKSSEVTDG
jgi:inosine/xanthosine triphosphatase